MAAEPEVFPLVVAAAEPSLVVVVLAAEPEVFPLFVAAAELSPVVVVLVAEPEVFPLVVAAAEPEAAVSVAAEPVVFAAVVSVADVAEPRASVDTAVASAVLVPVSVVVAGVYSSGRPKFLAFPNADHFASSSSSDEVVGEESVHSSTGARTNYGLCSIPSNLDLHQNRSLELCYNNPSPGYNTVSDTNDLPTDATTNHHRRICPRLHQGRRRHKYRAARSTPAVRQTESAEEGWPLRSC